MTSEERRRLALEKFSPETSNTIQGGNSFRERYKEFIPEDNVDTIGDSMVNKFGMTETPISRALNAGAGKVGSGILGLAKEPLRAGAKVLGGGVNIAMGDEPSTPIQSDYLGEIQPLAASFERGKMGEEVRSAIGVGSELASYAPIGGAVKTVASAAKPLLQGAIGKVAKKAIPAGVEGTAAGFLGEASNQLQKGESNVAKLGGAALLSGVTAAAFPVVGATLGGGAKGAKAIVNKITELPEKKLDSNIKKLTQGMSLKKSDSEAISLKMGLELFEKEYKDINIPDITIPGSGVKKKIKDIDEMTIPEALSIQDGIDEKIVKNAKAAVEDARDKGALLDTSAEQEVLFKEIEKGLVSKKLGNYYLSQLKESEGNPVRIHDIVQEINSDLKKAYNNGGISDKKQSESLHEINEKMREKLFTLMERDEYAKAYKAGKAVKKALVSAYKEEAGEKSGISAKELSDLAIETFSSNPVAQAFAMRGILSSVLKRGMNMVSPNQFSTIKKSINLTKIKPENTSRLYEAKIPSPISKVESKTK